MLIRVWSYHVSVTSPACFKRFLLMLFLVGIPAIGAPSDAGQQIFSSTCAPCHGLDGKGGEHGPDIAGNPRIQRLSNQDLLNVVRNGIVSGGMPAFGATFNGSQLEAVVAWLRSLQGKKSAAALRGDPVAGRSLFFGQAGCSECHMVAGKGGFIAPDLSNYGASRDASAIRERIVNPQRFARPGRGLVNVDTRAGKSFSGLVRNEDNFSLQLQARDGQFVFLEKRDVVRVTPQPGGLMPGDYGSRLSEAEIDNIVSFLARAADRP
jgi:putative heme-binding domain-containing protein